MRKVFRLGLAWAGLLFSFAACGVDPNIAFPPPRRVFVNTGPQATADLATLERGRKIYTTSCTECHVARTIGHYSEEQWHYYIGIMAPRAGLQPNDRAALQAYLLAARRSLPARESANPTR
jgi:mono/diheme cytochrome c family protein